MPATGEQESPKQRKERIRQRVIELDSYAAAARERNLSHQRVQQLAGPGLTSWGRHLATSCSNCAQMIPAGKRCHGLCHRCAQWALTHDGPWSAKAAKAARHARHQTHCKRGHPLTSDNLYISGTKRECRTCARERHTRWRKSANGRATVTANNRRRVRRKGVPKPPPPPKPPVQRRQRINGVSLAELRELVAHSSWRKASSITGIPVATLRELVDDGPSRSPSARTDGDPAS